MAKQTPLDELEIKLDLVDLVSPYGVIGKELYLFSEDAKAILQLPLQERKKALYELADKIKQHYGKTKLNGART